MHINELNVKIAGILFLVAMISSLIGGSILSDLFKNPDFVFNISNKQTLILIGISLEILNAVSIIGIAVLLFPLLKIYNESLTFGYLVCRIIESLFCILAAVVPFIVFNMSEGISSMDSLSNKYLITLSDLLLLVRNSFMNLLIPMFFSFGAFIFYHLLYKAKLIPRYISGWGFIGASLILVLAFIKAEVFLSMILVLPIILNEIFLGIWMIIKGFNLSEKNAGIL